MIEWFSIGIIIGTVSSCVLGLYGMCYIAGFN